MFYWAQCPVMSSVISGAAVPVRLAQSLLRNTVECDYFMQDFLNGFLYDVSMSVGQCDDRIGSFFNGFDMIFINHKLLAVDFCKNNHKNLIFSASRRVYTRQELKQSIIA